MFFEVHKSWYIDNAEFDASFNARLELATIVCLNAIQFIWSVDRLVMDYTIQFKGEFEWRNIDVEFSIDGVGSVKVKLGVWI